MTEVLRPAPVRLCLRQRWIAFHIVHGLHQTHLHLLQLSSLNWQVGTLDGQVFTESSKISSKKALHSVLSLSLYMSVEHHTYYILVIVVTAAWQIQL